MVTQSKRVLVVDDDPAVCTLTRRVLEDKGFSTVSAANGAEALAAVRTEPPDIVLLDLDMPGTDGWGFLEQLESSPRPSVVFVSGKLDFDAFARGTRAGVAAFVAKPIHYTELAATCQRIFEAPPSAPAAPGAEHRRSERRHFLVRIDVLSKLGTSRAVGELRDLSAGGAQVITTGPLDVGATVRFALDRTVTGEPMKFDSEVRWCQALPDGYAHGLELVDIGPEQAGRLRQVLGGH
jgi:CheY-like chemotaxis protein